MAMATIASLSPATSSFSKLIEIKKRILEGFTSIKHVKHVHAALFRFGLHQDSYLLNLVLKASFNFDQTNYTRLIFHQAKDPNVFLWNTMIQGLVSTDCFLDATQFYVSMRTQGFWPNNFTFPFVLKACSRLLDFPLGIRIHALVIKLGFDRDVFIKTRVCFTSIKHVKHVHAALFRFGLHQDSYLLNLVLKASFNFDQTNYTRLIFHQAKDPNVFLWNTMIQGLVSTDCFLDATQFYVSMRTQGFWPNNFTFPFVLKACSRLLDFPLGIRIHALVIKLGFDRDVFIKTSLLYLYSKCGYLDYARKVFDDIPDKNVISWTAMISGYIDVERYREAVDLFRKLIDMGLRPDSFSVVRVLSACAHLGDLNSGEWIDRCITQFGLSRNVFVATALVDMYAKCGNMEKARYAFDGVPVKDIVTWSTMIQGYASNGLPKEALDLFFQMQKEKLAPDRYSMVGVLSACARLGAVELGDWASKLMDIEEFLSNPVLGTALIDMYAKCGSMTQAWEIFKRMKEKDVVVWIAAISGLAMNGHVKPAFGLFGKMEKSGIRPNANTFMGLLCGCTHVGLVNDGRRYFDSMNRVFSLTPTIEHYGCMVDLLARAGLTR
ncbi:hypothetical protein GOBAR_AA03863 [Gossypium barbadense]|uniref:Pentacotripeptide-repeat region of PRORP domain-containing protein n=1 Tax=Gossypium barbadense TaxID=3634 RepID=A0A2P5YM99_GOSBA|nr:hypothetical protein GOBAR_AA03863 [Gossypium barbadense]